MGTNDDTGELSNADAIVEVVACSNQAVPANQPPLLKPETRAQRQAKLGRSGLVMLGIMAGFLLLMGAVGSIKWDNELTRAIYTNAEHRYALAALNVSSGLIFWIALIGLYLPADWGIKLNVIGCAWFLVGTILIEVFEADKIVWTESIADVVFWGAFPIVQIVCILAGRSRNPAFVGRAADSERGNA